MSLNCSSSRVMKFMATPFLPNLPPRPILRGREGGRGKGKREEVGEEKKKEGEGEGGRCIIIVV